MPRYNYFLKTGRKTNAVFVNAIFVILCALFFALFLLPLLAQAKSTHVFISRMPILMYHMAIEIGPGTSEMNRIISVTPQQLEQQFRFLAAQKYRTLFMRELADRKKKKSVVPRRTVALTFDDGTVDFYETVFPLLKQYNLKATLFANPGYNGTNDRMTHKMLRELHESGLVEIAAHTLNHVKLTTVLPEIMSQEIIGSKKILEKITGAPVLSFAYPFGAYDESVRAVVVASGFSSAVIADESSIGQYPMQYSLPRRMVGNGDNMSSFKAKLRAR